MPEYIASVNGSNRKYYQNEKNENQELIPGLLEERFRYFTKVIYFQFISRKESLAMMLLRRMLLLSIYSLDSRQHLVIFHILVRYSIVLYVEYERSLKMTSIDFISTVGGLFGLCLGFSFISFIEILYWFIIRLGRNMKKA